MYLQQNNSQSNNQHQNQHRHQHQMYIQAANIDIKMEKTSNSLQKQKRHFIKQDDVQKGTKKLKTTKIAQNQIYMDHQNQIMSESEKLKYIKTQEKIKKSYSLKFENDQEYQSSHNQNYTKQRNNKNGPVKNEFISPQKLQQQRDYFLKENLKTPRTNNKQPKDWEFFTPEKNDFMLFTPQQKTVHKFDFSKEKSSYKINIGMNIEICQPFHDDRSISEYLRPQIINLNHQRQNHFIDQNFGVQRQQQTRYSPKEQNENYRLSQYNSFYPPFNKGQLQYENSKLQYVNYQTPEQQAKENDSDPKPKVLSKCTCKNSKCLKKYCKCFRNGQMCVDCDCKDCHNNEEHKEERDKKIAEIQKKDKNAFASRLQLTQDNKLVHTKGCTCKNNKCIQKYCECFKAGIKCQDHCNCQDCLNGKCQKDLTQVQNQQQSTLIKTAKKDKPVLQSSQRNYNNQIMEDQQTPKKKKNVILKMSPHFKNGHQNIGYSKQAFYTKQINQENQSSIIKISAPKKTVKKYASQYNMYQFDEQPNQSRGQSLMMLTPEIKRNQILTFEPQVQLYKQKHRQRQFQDDQFIKEFRCYENNYQ